MAWKLAGKSRVSTIVGGMMLAVVAACSTTEFKSTWKDPNAQPNELQNRRVAAFVVTPNEALRRSAEDSLSRELTKRGVYAVPGYQMASNQDLADKDKLRARLAQQGIQAAIMMRVIDTRQEVNYVPGVAPYYGSFYGYWDYGWSAAYDPGYLTTDTVVSVETLVYSVPDGKLIWGGVSETIDPDKVDSFVKEVVDKATDEMKKQGLISK